MASHQNILNGIVDHVDAFDRVYSASVDTIGLLQGIGASVSFCVFDVPKPCSFFSDCSLLEYYFLAFYHFFTMKQTD